ncbi:hypothetical protein KSP39_PZI005920 [Platanthera zijinensis]|uniref:Thioredoxin domain-containing protein n=1 Tax=Platanthera zijinensis TaxID=2320716 RepID=A0AAP0BTE0_9ASPA
MNSGSLEVGREAGFATWIVTGGIGGGWTIMSRMGMAVVAEVVTACSWNELVLSSDMPVLVEFWASWCGPCKMVGRLMDELAHEYSGKIQCFRIDADDYPRVAALYGVERIPTILVFKHAEKLEMIVGTLPKSVYVAAIQKLLAQ